MFEFHAEKFPASPGVYIMKDADGTVLYVGKAVNLRSRVRSYFGKRSDGRYQVQFLMSRVAAVEYLVTDTEKEALILENTLIKQHRPRYNINLRDDKTYFSLRMDMREEFPRLTVVRKVVRDGARYFGPYSSGSAARDVLNQLYRIFPLRHYPLESCRRRKRPCLFFQIGRCSAPCHGRITAEEYALIAAGAALFLEGKRREVAAMLKGKMLDAAESERFEEAAQYRDLLQSVEVTLEKQKMVLPEGEFDVIGFHRDGSDFDVALLFVRGGVVTGGRNFTFRWQMEDEEAVSSFLTEYYGADVFIPQDILLPVKVEEGEALEELLTEKRGRKVTLSVPARGMKAELVRLATKNAGTAAAERRDEEAKARESLEELRERLHLSRLPRRMECYDISNFQGQLAVGSRVTFQDGKPDRKGYRMYRIRTVEGSNDFGMLYEVLSRRFRHGVDEPDLPDLIVIDGGIGQLNVLREVMGELKMAGAVDIVSLAKSRVESDVSSSEIRRSEERVFLPGRKNPVILRQNSRPLLMLAHLRDEAHRFAITYHQKIRSSRNVSSILDEAPGIGPTRKRSLLKHFGSVRKIREATPEEVMEVKGMTRKGAEDLIDFLKGAAAPKEEVTAPEAS